MKKVLAIVLSLTLVISGFAVVFADTPSDVANLNCETAVKALVEYGIVDGYPDGTYRPEKSITRAEATKLLVEALGYGDALAGAAGISTDLSDIDGHWAEAYIKLAYQLGVIKGYPDRTFRPDDPISYNEIVTMLLGALGYTPESLGGTWPDNYLAKVAELGITQGVSLTDGPANRGDVAILLYQTLDKPMGQVTDGVWAPKTDEDGNPVTLLDGLDLVVGPAEPEEKPPASGGSSTSGSSTSRLRSYDSLTEGNCLRPFTLLGYIDGNMMNLREVAPNAEIYYAANPSKHTYTYGGKVSSGSHSLVGSFVELWDTNKDGKADRILSVPRSMSKTYWNADMYWLAGVGEDTDPSVDDETGEAVFGQEHAIPMGERLLTGYGLGDWSGTTDFYNQDEETYWPFIDYYNAASSETLTMLTGYRSALQATGGTCGPTSALTVLDWFGVREDLNEQDLSGLRQPQPRWGGFTALTPLTSIFENLADLGITGEWDLYSSYDDPEALFDSEWVQQTLAGGSPIMVGWNSFGGHWQVIIGYDNMGTEQTNDDVLILMDPYDSTDHMNDGYNIQSYERLAYGIGFEDLNPGEGEFWHTSFLVATPVGWEYEPVIGEGIPEDSTNIADFTDTHKIPYGDAAADIQEFYPTTPFRGDNGLAGAATGGYERSGDYNNSPYYKFFNFYNMESSDSLVMLEEFRTTQQVTEWTCGLSSILMVMDWFGMNEDDLTEIDLALMRQGGKPGATTVNGMEEVFANLQEYHDEDWAWFTMRDFDGDAAELIPELLELGIPMMIGWDEWGGHWQVIIGYDDMGTEETQDDILILADPYDTTDHNQDGYVLESFERLVYGWTARFDESGAFVVAFPAGQYPDLAIEMVGANVRRHFTLAGSFDGDFINLIEIGQGAKAYVWDEEDGFVPTVLSEDNVVGNFVKLLNTRGASNSPAEVVLIVKAEDSTTYWDPNESEAPFDNAYQIPFGERLLDGYGLSGATEDYSNIIDYADDDGSTLDSGLNYYWPQHDYYNAESNDTLTILTNYKSTQQTNGSNCGLTSALTALEWFGERGDLNEHDLVGLREKSSWGGATTLAQLENVFKNLEDLGLTSEWDLYSSYDDPEALFDSEWVQQTLAGGSPIMVGWNSFGGHWQVIIGYDNMGTDGTADDVLILMDPYDSTDWNNDGYNLQSYERLAYGLQSFDSQAAGENGNWNTLFLAATPVDWEHTPVMTGYTIPATNPDAMDFGASYGEAVEENWIDYRDSAADIQEFYPKTTIWGTGDDGLAGPATGSYRHTGDVEYSSYYSHFDFYNMESTDTLILLEEFKTTQQVTEWTCGLSSALMVIEWFDANDDELTEIDLAQMRQEGKTGATKIAGMAEVFETLNEDHDGDWIWFTTGNLKSGRHMGGYYLEDGAEDEGLIPYLLSEGIPMMIGWDEWGGHWQVIVGYDDMGTPDTQDDILILADPYDTTDHNMDGYVIESFERLVYGWGARFDVSYALIVAFPQTGYEDVISELDLN